MPYEAQHFHVYLMNQLENNSEEDIFADWPNIEVLRITTNEYQGVMVFHTDGSMNFWGREGVSETEPNQHVGFSIAFTPHSATHFLFKHFGIKDCSRVLLEEAKTTLEQTQENSSHNIFPAPEILQ